MEMQSKLGPKSCRALFMGYPEGVKGYRLCDTTSSAFFVAHDIIFDEDFGGTEDEEGEDKDEPALSLPPFPCPPLQRMWSRFLECLPRPSSPLLWRHHLPTPFTSPVAHRT